MSTKSFFDANIVSILPFSLNQTAQEFPMLIKPIFRTALAAFALSICAQAAKCEPVSHGYRPAGSNTALRLADYNTARNAHISYRSAYRRHRRNDGPPYGRCYLRCINSGHPADFCRDVSSDFCG
jgi:hypothetical protein